MKKEELTAMAKHLINKIECFFGNRVNDFQILNVFDAQGHECFSVYFTAYNYYSVKINYDIGHLEFCIVNDNNSDMMIKTSQKLWETADYDVFFREVQEELELRIPDKFLKKKGWLE